MNGNALDSPQVELQLAEDRLALVVPDHPAPAVALALRGGENPLRGVVLIDSRARRRTSLEYYDDPAIRAEVKREIAALTRRIESYQDAIDHFIGQDEAIRRKRELLTRTTGIGPAVSMTLVVTFPELGTLNRKEAAALAGLAPMNRDSGAARGRRTIQAGRSKPRKALYMAALTAAHRNPMFAPHYQQLIARGKPVKVALCAIARKLLIHLNTQLKEAALQT